MQPYRVPGETPQEPPPPSRWARVVGFYRKDPWFLLCFSVLGLVTGVTAGFMVYHAVVDPPPKPKPCSDFADYAASNVPARCTKNFNPEAP